MDRETLVNHMKGLSKAKFDDVCRLIINKCYGKTAINVDGKGDGGADIIELDENGKRTSIVYQLTTQKNEVELKYARDAKKATTKLGAKVFFFMTSQSVSEQKVRKLESDISEEFDVRCTCLDAKAISNLLIEGKLVKQFLLDADLFVPHSAGSGSIDYREQVLHSYTIWSSDAKNLKEGIYDDTILIILGKEVDYSLEITDLIEKVKSQLALTDTMKNVIERRISSLLMKRRVIDIGEGKIKLTEDSIEEIENRERLYVLEMDAMSSAQTDLLSQKYKISWVSQDARKVAVWLANIFIDSQLRVLKETQINYISHPLLRNTNKKVQQDLLKFLKKKGVSDDSAKQAYDDLLKLAANDPLITKITRASMYVALEGASPLSRSRVLGISSWDEAKIMLDPSVAIPCICSNLYLWPENEWFSQPVRVVKKCQDLGCSISIPAYYIGECAGHLMSARYYQGLDDMAEELQFSNNAFVAYYYGLKKAGIKTPPTLAAFLNTFSAQISTSGDNKSIKHAIMTDLQGTLSRIGISFENSKFYEVSNCSVYPVYKEIVDRIEPQKRTYLLKHDVFALQHMTDKYAEGEHWILLSFDKTLIEYAKNDVCQFWITNTKKMAELIESTQDLSAVNLENIVHFLASASEHTLSLGAKMIDRIVEYAYKEMQNWEFQQDFIKYKNESLSSIDLEKGKQDLDTLAKELVNKFLSQKGINIDKIEAELNEDEEINNTTIQ